MIMFVVSNCFAEMMCSGHESPHEVFLFPVHSFVCTFGSLGVCSILQKALHLHELHAVTNKHHLKPTASLLL